MPFPSLRRKTAGDLANVGDKEKPTSPTARTRSNTTPTPTLIRPKSFASLKDAQKRGTTSSASPTVSAPDPLEQDLYPHYDTCSPGYDPQRNGLSPFEEASTRLRRSPSPHPRKWRGTAPSRRERLHRLSLTRSRSDTSLHGGTPSKTFLETLADAIRAPAALFYRDHKAGTAGGTIEPFSGPAAIKTPSPGGFTDVRKISPQKSVRFEPCTSIINESQKSSPINIPKAFPSLPPIQLATTPLLQCFGKSSIDPVPTARPPQLQVLHSSVDFRRALTEAQSAIPVLDLAKCDATARIQKDLPTPLPGTNLPMEDPFATLIDEPALETNQTLLAEYEDQFYNKPSVSVTATDVMVDNTFISNDERVQDLQTDSSQIAKTLTKNAFQYSLSHESSPSARFNPSEGNTLFESKPISTTPPQAKEISNHITGRNLGSSSEKECLLDKSNFSERHPDDNISLNADTTSYGSAWNLQNNETNLPQVMPTSENMLVIGKWHRTPTHEDIRQRFKGSRSQKSSPSNYQYAIDVEAPISDGNSNICCDASISPLPDITEGLRNLALDDPIREEANSDRRCSAKVGTETPRSMLPMESFSTGSEAPVGFWTADLALRSEKPVTFTSCDIAEENYDFFEPTVSRHRRVIHTDEALESESVTSLPSTRQARDIAEQIDFSSEAAAMSSTPLTIKTLGTTRASFTESRCTETPSPAGIALPISVSRQVKASQYRYSDQEGWSPFEEPKFPYAIIAASDAGLDQLRSLLSSKGGFYKFWQKYQLPQTTMPAHDTQGLAPFEIDDIIDTVKDLEVRPEFIAPQFLNSSQSVLQIQPMRGQSVSTVSNVYRKGVQIHLQEGTSDTFVTNHSDDGTMIQPGVHGKELGLNKDLETIQGAQPDDITWPKISRSHSAAVAANDVRGCPLPEASEVSCALAGEREVEEHIAGYRGEESDTPRQRRQTLQSQNSQGTGPDTGTWSMRSGHSSITSVTSTSDGMDEDENFCKGIV